MSRLGGLLAAAAAGVSAGCMSGGGDGSGAAPGTTGSVTVLIGDSPLDVLEHVFIDITRVTLIPSGDASPVAVFEGEEKIDLLRFRDTDFVLAVNAGVPVGTYEKIRVEFSEVEVEPADVCPELKVPSGKIDLNPRGPIDVLPGAPLVLRLDIDARKSIFIHEVGGTGQCIFRPVIFVGVRETAEEEGEDEECAKEVAGTIERVLSGGRALLVDLGGQRGTVRVEIGDGTAVFGPGALPASPGTFQPGDHVLARGEMEAHGAIEALWVMRGDPLALRGTFLSPVVDGKFTFKPRVASALPGRTGGGTLVLAGCGAEALPLSAVASGQEATVVGAAGREGDSSFLQAAVIEISATQLRGSITALDPLQRMVTVNRSPQGSPPSPASFRFDERTAILLVGDGALAAGDLRVGQTISVGLDPGRSRANRIEVEPEEVEGVVLSFDPAGRSIIVGASAPSGPDTPVAEVLVTVPPQATVILIKADDLHQVELGVVREGDRIDLFGLAPSEGVLVAHTVVVRR